MLFQIQYEDTRTITDNSKCQHIQSYYTYCTGKRYNNIEKNILGKDIRILKSKSQPILS